MDVVLCSGHQKPCFLKTGTRKGLTQGKSFYICSIPESRCQFVKPVDLKPLNCPVHPDTMVDLQAVLENPKTQEKQHLMRCHARTQEKKWCIYRTFKPQGTESKMKEDLLSFKSLNEYSKKRTDASEISNQPKPREKKSQNFTQWRDSPVHKAQQSDSWEKPADQLKKNLSKHYPKSKEEPPSFKSISEANTETSTLPVKTLADNGNKEKANDSFTQWRESSVAPKEDRISKDYLKKDLQRQLEKQQKLLSCTKLSELPDNGARLLKKTKEIEECLAELELETEENNHNDSDVQIISSSFPTGKLPQVVKVFPPAASGQNPIHKPTTQEVDPPKSVKEWIDNNYKIHKSHVPHNPDMLAQTKLWSKDYDDLKEREKQIAAYNQQRTLYGGRMTVKRLEAVREAMKSVIDSLHKQLDTCPKESDTLPDPEGLKVSLMQHQKQALAWLTWRENQVPSGGILADDMGLGKTLTMISLILTQKQQSDEATKAPKWLGKGKPAVKSPATLIITPASLIHQWNSEISNRCRHKMLRVLVYHGPNRVKDVSLLAQYDIVLTTYKIISSEIGRKEDSKFADLPLEELEGKEEEEEDVSQLPLLLKIIWNRIILDEAHDIRNHKSVCAMAICRLRANTRWAVTGTPIQNKLLDMFSLIRFLRFSPFDEYKVWKKQVESNEALGKARLNTIIKSLMLRRTKTQMFEGKPLVNLSKKELFWNKLTLSKAERNLYNKIYKKTQSVVRNYIQRHEDKEMTGATGGEKYLSSESEYNPFQAGSSQGSGSDQQATNAPRSGKDILVFLLRLRQCCCHPGLLKEKETGDESLDLELEDQMKDLLLDKADPSEEDKTPEEDIFQLSTKSTKIEALLENLLNIRKTENAKCVVVSEWTKMLSLVALHLKEAGLRYHLLQGDVLPKKRMEMVEDFNKNHNGAEVMLLSLKAGGVGLNLIGGSHLFLMDSHWNPALEEQTCDRIHRVGQKKDVKIHRFICENTIEEKILVLQDKKRTLAKDVLSGDGMKTSRLGLNDLRMLFDI